MQKHPYTYALERTISFQPKCDNALHSFLCILNRHVSQCIEIQKNECNMMHHTMQFLIGVPFNMLQFVSKMNFTKEFYSYFCVLPMM